MKKPLSVFIFVLLIACNALMLSSCGDIVDDDNTNVEFPDLTYTLLNDNTYSVSIGASNSTEIQIPSEYNGKAVTQISGRVNRSESLVVTLINQSLVSVEIPNSITTIDPCAFYGCKKLENIKIINNNERYSSKNGILYSKDDTALICYPSGKASTSFSIPESITSIGAFAFSGCEQLKSITLSDGVTSIGDSAFENCKGIESILIPESVTSIGASAFSGCEQLKSITLSDGVTSIGDSAFKNCKGMESILIPESVTSIGDCAFINCDNIKIYSEAAKKPRGWSQYLFNQPLYWSGSEGSVFWYSESKPEDKQIVGGSLGSTNYWHYVDGKIVIWD